MPNITLADYIAHEERIARGKAQKSPKDAADRETGKGGLHEEIMEHCDSQWPRWKYIHSRTDLKSTVAVGSQDFTVFLPNGRVLCVEAKAKNGKLSNEQLGWAHEMRLLGHTVHVVYNLEQFVELTK